MSIDRQPANAETRFDRGAALVLAGVLAFVALVVVVTLAILNQPGDGWQIPGDNQVSELAYFYGDWPTPLRQGDVVLAVNGLNVNSAEGGWLTHYDLPAWRAGATVTYTVQRAGQMADVPVTLRQADAPGLWRLLAHAVLDSPGEWSWLVVAVIVFWLRPGSRAARLLLMVMVSHAAETKLGWAATVVAVNFTPAWQFFAFLLTNNFWIWLFWPCLIWLVLSFPLPVFPLTRWPRLTPALLFALPGAGLALSAVSQNVLPVTVALVGELALLLLALLLAVINAIRRREAVARAQVSWIILGLGASLGVNLAAYLLDYFHPFLAGLPAWPGILIDLILPVCLGIAITRYRLFDVDIIIRRTLLYSVLTALLAAVYFGSVVVLQAIVTDLTGAQRSELVMVLSTLVIAALFVPLRRRLQGFIDQRFYRRRYDAARTLAGFAQAARDEVDLDRLSAELVRVVQDTMQPATADLWLAPHER